MEYNYLGKNFGNYAMAGNSCQTSMDTLLDNRKFLPLDDPVYNLVYTRMYQYPFHSQSHIHGVDHDRMEARPESLKTNGEHNKVEDFQQCCGKRKK